MRSLSLLAFMIAVSPWNAAAQEPTPRCVAGTPSFAITEANRLSCAEFQKMRAQGATVIMIRPHGERPNCEYRLTRPGTARGDGSFVQFCEIRCQARGRGGMGFDWRPCPADGPTGRTTGTAVCKNGVWCGGVLGNQREAETCVAVHRDGDRYAYAFVSGRPGCLPGDLTIKPR